MNYIHADPASNGTKFGEVTVTVDLAAGDCVVHAPRPGPIMPVMRRFRFHSLEEIQKAYQVQVGWAATDPVAADLVKALQFAGTLIKEKQEGHK